MNNVELQNKIGYNFCDESLLLTALTHSSYVKEKNYEANRSNERLEFLGDAFFDAIISEELYKRLESAPEGTLSKTRAMVVCEKSLALCGRQLAIGKHIFLGKGEEATQGREKNALIADALEAVFGAIYLDGGYEAVKEVVLRLFKDTIENAVLGKLACDYKTELQEKLQAKGEARIQYLLEKEEGPDHEKVFYINLFCGGKFAGAGRGKSKKEAEQNAAKEALERGLGICT